MKGFLFDTHIHTSESSSCGRFTAAEVVERYKSLGYDGIIVTDHMNRHNLKKLGDTYAEQLERFLDGYHAAKALADEKFRVILGMEIRFLENDNDYLVYGFDEEFLKTREFSSFESIEEFKPFAEENGLIVIQAHPFRPGMTVTEAEFVDGVEVYNGHASHNSSNDIAYRWAKKYSLRMLSGSDFHWNIAMEPGGVYFEECPENSFDVARLIRDNKYELKIYTE